MEAVRAWAEFQGLKFHHIVLARGTTPSQPMISRRGHGSLQGQQAAVGELIHKMKEAGLSVTRVKIEADTHCLGVPRTDPEAGEHPGRYFEHHVKLLLDSTANTDDLVALARRHAAHLSRNARRVRSDERQERFVTQRCHSVGATTARVRLAALLEDLKRQPVEVLGIEEEFVVLDSNPEVDAGWMGGGT